MTDLVEKPGAALRPAAEQVADTFMVLMQTFVKARNRTLAAAARDVEWSGLIILKAVRGEGPIRAGALAELVQSDPSTVSRQVAALVKDGLLERRADPQDGRAALLVVTDRAREVLAGHDRIRLEQYVDMLTDWSDDDLARFAELLRRFTDDYENANYHWVNERFVRDAARSGGHD